MNEKLGNRMQSIDSGKWLPEGLIQKNYRAGSTLHLSRNSSRLK
ncbi:hypothetical protein [Hydrogenovibrio kuenenii]|nr:hypothetical protein [Hydrogenovibrio kuenenii]